MIRHQQTKKCINVKKLFVSPMPEMEIEMEETTSSINNQLELDPKMVLR
jgi:hypothetical protein